MFLLIIQFSTTKYTKHTKIFPFYRPILFIDPKPAWMQYTCSDANPNGTGSYMKQWEDVCKILESIANSFDKNSVQYDAMEQAAQAFVFLNMHKDLKEAYQKYQMECDKELSGDQKQHLRNMGIDPDKKP